MAVVRGCNIPEDLVYNVDNNTWARKESDGSVTVGVTSYACSLAGEIVSYLPKKSGKYVDKDKSCATVESGKWVGPVKTPVAGEVVAINDTLHQTPSLINKEPYGRGWIVKLRPNNWDADIVGLSSGADVGAAFEAKMDADGFKGC